MKKNLQISAIIIFLNEEPFIEACIKAIYEHVNRIIIVTNYDTDYWGHHLEADRTTDLILNYPDVEKKIHLILGRKIMDEVLQRNWAIEFDRSLSALGGRKFEPRAFTLRTIHENYPKTDYYWIIDADEIYDPETVPNVIDFVANSKGKNVLVRGYNHFKKWNYRISLESDHFWQLGFLRSDHLFYGGRGLYSPKFLGRLSYLHREISENLVNAWKNQIKLPESIGHFYHGSHIGDDRRIQKKLLISSHAHAQKKYVDQWMKNVWNVWSPSMKNFHPGPDPSIFSEVVYIPTENLPQSIREATWPEGWIDLLIGSKHSKIS